MSRREAFVTELFDQYQSILRVICWRYVEHEKIFADTIDESVLDTFLQAYSSYDCLRNHPNVQGWLIITCLNRLKPRINQVRSREKHRAFSMDDPQAPQFSSGEAWEENNVLQLDAREQINQLYTTLTEAEQQIFQEHYVQGFTLQAVAQHLHKSLASVKASLRQIKRKALKQKKLKDLSD